MYIRYYLAFDKKLFYSGSRRFFFSFLSLAPTEYICPFFYLKSFNFNTLDGLCIRKVFFKKKVFLCLPQCIDTYSLSASVYFYWWWSRHPGQWFYRFCGENSSPILWSYRGEVGFKLQMQHLTLV